MAIARIGIIGDVHCEDEYLAKALAFLHEARLDLLVCTGDIPTGKGDINRCCQLLQEFGVAAVRGNHDRWFLSRAMGDLPDATREDEVNDESRASLISLPVTRSYQTVAGCLLLCHGLGEDDMAGVRPGDSGYAIEANLKLQALYSAREYDFVVNGHTHHRLVRSFDHLTIINAGTLRREHYPCFATADFQSGMVQYYDIRNDGEIIEAKVSDIPVAIERAKSL